ncbi:MAG: sigma-54 dependent transcriptional regulator [Saprospiraceae bacterium]|nr:sigma-54 dependent transcriptional regulator [Saprospiraceae bacterium]MDW8483450.1 sigma-54 dependent transcriptional regulator [Saprospiraceae bacterium]
MTSLQVIKARFGIIGTSPLLDAALQTAIRVAPTDLTVLITGESGVGKEVFSKIIHALSTRKHHEFIAVNCGAIPEGTINSELFGHEKGAFTGAISDRKGYFETANGGTIFLDEIAEMPSDTQAYLLRVLEYGEFMRVGSSKVLKTDVRVIAATNVDLEEHVRRGKFREDLYYRLSTVPIRVPALKDRREDIYLLFQKFANDFAEKYRMQPIRLTEEAREVLENYRWPGNVRELKNITEQLSVLSEERHITVDILRQHMPHLFTRSLPAPFEHYQAKTSEIQDREILYRVLLDMKNDLNDLKTLILEVIHRNNLQMPEAAALRRLMPSAEYTPAPASTGSTIISQTSPIVIEPTRSARPIQPLEEEDAPLAMDEIEKEAIRRALKKHRGRRKEAAEELKISERTLYRKIKQYNLS